MNRDNLPSAENQNLKIDFDNCQRDLREEKDRSRRADERSRRTEDELRKNLENVSKERSDLQSTLKRKNELLKTKSEVDPRRYKENILKISTLEAKVKSMDGKQKELESSLAKCREDYEVAMGVEKELRHELDKNTEDLSSEQARASSAVEENETLKRRLKKSMETFRLSSYPTGGNPVDNQTSP